MYIAKRGAKSKNAHGRAFLCAHFSYRKAILFEGAGRGAKGEEQANEEQDVELDKEYAARDPIDLADIDVQTFKRDKSIYKRVDVSNREAMLRDARQLDEDQRVPFDLIMRFVKGIRASEQSSMRPPMSFVLGN